MTVQEAIAAADAILPGEAAPEGARDPRWQAIIVVGEFIEDAVADPLFGDMVRGIWKFGQSEDPGRSERLDRLFQLIAQSDAG